MESNDAGVQPGQPVQTVQHVSGAADLATVWRTLIVDLPPSQRAWLAASRPVTLHEHTAIIAVADEFTRNQLEGRLRTRLEDALGNAFGTQVRIAVTVDPELEGSGTLPAPAAEPQSDAIELGDHMSMSPPIDMSTNPLDVPTPMLSPTAAAKPAGYATITLFDLPFDG